MNTTWSGAGSMRYAPSRARMRWLATLPIGCASPRVSMRTSSDAAPSPQYRDGTIDHGPAAERSPTANEAPRVPARSAQLGDGAAEDALEAASRTPSWGDPGARRAPSTASAPSGRAQDELHRAGARRCEQERVQLLESCSRARALGVEPNRDARGSPAGRRRDSGSTSSTSSVGSRSSSARR